jgi:hypothetical protein
MRMILQFRHVTKRRSAQPSYLLPIQAQELHILSSLRTAREVADALNATAIQLSTAA